MIEMKYTPDDMKKLPLRAIVAFAARCGRRVEHLAVPPGDHPEAAKLSAAIAEAIRVAEDFARGAETPSAEAAVEAIEAGRAAVQGDIIRENAYAAIARVAHAAATAIRAIAEKKEPAERQIIGAGERRLPLAPVAGVSADLVAMGAFTAAMDAAEAIRSTDEFTRWAAEDYRKLLGLKLGQYPEPGEPIDASSEGPLGPLRPKEDTGF